MNNNKIRICFIFSSINVYLDKEEKNYISFVIIMIV